MTTSKPAFVFVPGAWHSPEYFEKVIELLSKKGFSSHSIHLASVGAPVPLENFDADVEIIRKAISALTATGTDVVVVMHSYGGIPTSEAMKYFLDENEGKNGTGRIIRMVWLCSFILPKGESLTKGRGDKAVPGFLVKDGEIIPTAPEPVFYNDLPKAEAEKWASKLKPHSHRTFFSEVSVEPWMTIPSAYLFCEKDNAIPIAVQESMVNMAKEKNAKAFDLVERCEAGHSPFLSIPDTVAAFLLNASGSV